MTTGGGWQDQIGSIYGGFKLGYSRPMLPLEVSVHDLFGGDCCEANSRAITIGKIVLSQVFSSRVFLVYTGQQRLAKNTLIQALMRGALTPFQKHDMSGVRLGCFGQVAITEDTLGCLLENAINASLCITSFKELCIFSCDQPNATAILIKAANDTMDALASVINDYWELKREMAAGSEPEHLRQLRRSLAPHCLGWSLCGAGGGGFAVAILPSGASAYCFREEVEKVNKEWEKSNGFSSPQNKQIGNSAFTRHCKVHSASLDFEGISVIGCHILSP